MPCGDRVLLRVLALFLGACCVRCTPPDAERSSPAQSSLDDTPDVDADAADNVTDNDARRVSVEELKVPDDLPAYVLHGARGDAKIVFLHGMCGHGQGYVQAFANAAAEHGTVIALSGDFACGEDPAFRKWSADIQGIDGRVREAFAAAEMPLAENEEVVVIGLSQGALRAESLVERFPDRYTRAIFIGSPRAPAPARVRNLKSAVIMAGEHEGTWPMKEGAKSLVRAHVPATFIMIPGAHHAQLLEGERVMGDALDFVFRPAPQAVRPSS
jgi:predicted esterase